MQEISDLGTLLSGIDLKLIYEQFDLLSQGMSRDMFALHANYANIYAGWLMFYIMFGQMPSIPIDNTISNWAILLTE